MKDIFRVDILDLKKRNIFIVVIVLMFIVLALPTLARFYSGNSSFIGAEPYYHFRISNSLAKAGELNPFAPSSGVDDMTYLDRKFDPDPFHYLLVYASWFVSLAGAVRIVPFLLGILSILVFERILRRFVSEDHKRHIILGLLVLNPVFIYTFTVANPHCAAIFFTLLGFCLFMEKRFFWLSVACFVIVSLFSIFNTILVLLLLLAFVLWKRDMHNRLIITFLFLAASSAFSRPSFFYSYTFSNNVDILGNLFSDLGGLLGFGLFTVILAFYGVFSNWKDKGSFFSYLVLGLLLLASLFFVGNMANMYLSFFVAVAAGIGFVKLYEIDWAVKDLRNLTVLVLVCGLLFSSASYLNRLTNIGPDEDVVDGLIWLGSNTFKDGFVLSDYHDGFLISTVSRNPVLADSLLSSSYDQRFVYKIQDSIFYAKKVSQARALLDAYNAKYVFVEPSMTDDGVWSRENEGLLFLLTNQANFKKVYDEAGVMIWEVLEVES